ncbi:hypothetical protein HDU96_006991 [Phlyctochytrium bullatum]|nr:hypothetical protein HDU96_006991 [Phlyctochytrium bullatum]
MSKKAAAKEIVEDKKADTASTTAAAGTKKPSSLEERGKQWAKKVFPVIRPLLIGLFLTNAIDYVTNLYKIELDTVGRMSIMVISYVFLTNLSNRVLPFWLTNEGPNPDFIKNPIQPLPSDTLVLLKGEPVSIGHPHPEGKKVVTVVEFWATWCAPCRTMIPELTRLHKKYADKDVYIASITFEDKKPVIDEFLVHLGHKIEYNLFWDPKSVAKETLLDQSNAKGIPFAIILNTENKVAWLGNPHGKGFEIALDREAAKATDKDPSKIKKALAEDGEKVDEKVSEIPSAAAESKAEKRVGRKVQDDDE